MTVSGPGGCARGWRGRLEVIDISDPARPVWVSALDFREPVQRVHAAAKLVYLASGRSLIVLTVTNATAPSVLGKCDTDDDIKSFQLRGQYAYAVRESHLDVFDVSNPVQPLRVGSSTNDFGGSASGVQVADNRAYVAAAHGLEVFDVSTPGQPVWLSTAQKSDSYTLAVDVAGAYAYVTTGEGLKILSIADPFKPMLVGTNLLGARGNGILMAGQYCYLTAGTRLEVLDISNPTQPSSVGSYDTGGSTSDLALADHYAFVAAGAEGLQILNLSDPVNLILVAIGTRETGGPAEGLQVVGNYAYLADGNSGLQIIDLASTDGLRSVARVRTESYARTIHIAGIDAFIGTDAGLEIMDVSNPVTPTRVGSLDCGPVMDIHVVGNLAFLTAGDLKVIDVRTPAQPRQIANVDGPPNGEYSSARAVQVVGQFAYLTYGSGWDGTGGLAVIDVLDPSAPRLVGSCATVGPAQDLHVVGSRAYVNTTSTPGRPEGRPAIRYKSLMSPTRPTPHRWDNVRSAKRHIGSRSLAATPTLREAPGVRTARCGAMA